MKKENSKNCFKTKHRKDEEKQKLIKRLNTICGQVKGVTQMVEEDRYCHDILIQISAINNSLKSLGNCILKGHMKSCMVDEIKKGNIEIIDDVVELFKRID